MVQTDREVSRKGMVGLRRRRTWRSKGAETSPYSRHGASHILLLRSPLRLRDGGYSSRDETMSIDAGDVEGDVLVQCDSAEAQAKVETPAFPGQGSCRFPQLLLSCRQTTTSHFPILRALILRLNTMPQVAKTRRMGRLMYQPSVLLKESSGPRQRAQLTTVTLMRTNLSLLLPAVYNRLRA